VVLPAERGQHVIVRSTHYIDQLSPSIAPWVLISVVQFVLPAAHFFFFHRVLALPSTNNLTTATRRSRPTNYHQNAHSVTDPPLDVPARTDAFPCSRAGKWTGFPPLLTVAQRCGDSQRRTNHKVGYDFTIHAQVGTIRAESYSDDER
jgi:hypothetical protein